MWKFDDAAHLSFDDETFDGICTSPTYGNRLADHWHRGENEHSTRFSYFFNLGHNLHEGNTGVMHWGHKYRFKHEQIWKEQYRILQPNGILICNISDFIRSGLVIGVVEFHRNTLLALGLKYIEDIAVPTKRLRFGQNNNARVDHEHILVFRKK